MSNEQTNTTSQAGAGRSMHPVLIVSERTLSDYPLVLERLLVGLADESIAAAMICPPGCGADSTAFGGLEVIEYPAFELPMIGGESTRRVVQVLRKFQPTVLHCFCKSKAALTRRLARQLDLPYVLAVNSLQGRWDRLRLSAKHCAKIIVPGRTVAASVANMHPDFAERVRQVNVGTFVAQEACCFNDPARRATMVAACPLRHAADLENLFGAVRRLVLDGYEFGFVIMGEGRAEGQLRRLLAALGLLPIVTVVPKLKPWRSALAAGDIFVQPRPTLAFDPVLLEAMSVGAAVASCRGGVDDLIIEDRTAAVFDPDDELSIAATLRRLFDRPERARRLAKDAQQHLRENHSVSAMISTTLHAYQEAQDWYTH
jgi:hypothetical protein